MKKREFIFIGIILLAAGVIWLLTAQPWKQKDIGSIYITVYGEEYGTYDLSKDQVISINNTNICEIKDGKAMMTDAFCPDHLCEQMAPVDGVNGGLIVCLPNQVIIEGIKSESAASDKNGIDAIGS